MNCIKDTKRQTSDDREASMKSNQIYFSTETKCEDLNHFVLLLNNEIASSIRLYTVTYLGPSHLTIREIISLFYNLDKKLN